ncbi:MAG TPA: DUF4238 domain-containing protein [Cellulomonadaceae bacterium]|nr:DUF4238 domain-containing protein [Cellulomonadaceae bacterium]
MPERAKRHHQVPRAYLNRFGMDETVRVRWRDGKTFETSTLNVAVESGFYDVPDPAGGKSSEVEDALAVVDGAAVEVLAAVDRSGKPPREGAEERFTLAVFLGLQMTRTTQHREQAMFPERVAEWAGGHAITQDLVAEYLERVHLGFPPRPREAEGAHIYVTKALEDGAATPEFAIRTMLQLVEAFVPRLLALTWTLELDRRERLITSDVPVVIARKPTRMDEFQGIGVDTADELRFPLDPGKQLVLSKRRRPRILSVEPHRIRHSNSDMVDGCHRFIVGRPDQRSTIDGARLLTRSPVMRFNVGPLLVEGPDGRKTQDSEVLHMFVPRRPMRR